MSVIMKSLNWPNNNTYINITPHPLISIWHVQPATSKSHILLTLCAYIHKYIYRASLGTFLKDSWLAHTWCLDKVNTGAKHHVGCANLCCTSAMQFLCSVFNFTAWGNSIVTSCPHMMPSCDSFSPSALKLVLAFPVKAQKQLSAHTAAVN